MERQGTRVGLLINAFMGAIIAQFANYCSIRTAAVLPFPSIHRRSPDYSTPQSGMFIARWEKQVWAVVARAQTEELP
jgi:hypothetical protein